MQDPPKNVDKERKSKTGQRLDGKISNARNKRIEHTGWYEE
jgi:hypothetical protein